jgi:hypothetical protein
MILWIEFRMKRNVKKLVEQNRGQPKNRQDSIPEDTASSFLSSQSQSYSFPFPTTMSIRLYYRQQPFPFPASNVDSYTAYTIHQNQNQRLDPSL